MDKYQYQENLISIKGFDDNYSGRSLFRSIVNPILRLGAIVIVECQRPNYQTELTEAKISSSSPSISDLEVDENWFSIRFKYLPNDQIDSFVNILASIWFSYEQPSVVFLSDITELGKTKHFTWRTKWETIAETVKSVILFKAIEDDVMWIGKSSDIKFEDFLFD